MRVKNWSKFQHYKDRNPPWLKLHKSLLDDPDFMSLSVEARATLPMLWLIASESDGAINPDTVAWRLRVKSVPLDELLEAGYLEHGTPEEKEAWPSRYIPAKVRSEMLLNALCAQCSSGDVLEIDHIVPVSKGGTSDRANLQVLCRPCNRKKRVSMPALERSKLLREDGTERSLEKRREEAYTEEKNPVPVREEPEAVDAECTALSNALAAAVRRASEVTGLSGQAILADAKVRGKAAPITNPLGCTVASRKLWQIAIDRVGGFVAAWESDRRGKAAKRAAVPAFDRGGDHEVNEADIAWDPRLGPDPRQAKGGAA